MRCTKPTRWERTIKSHLNRWLWRRFVYFSNLMINCTLRHWEVCTWLLVNTLKMCSSESGAKPWHSLILAITPATKVPWPRPEKQCQLINIHPSVSHTFQTQWLCLHAFTLLLTIIQRLLICPVGPFLHVLKMWVLFTQACIKHCHLYTRTCMCKMTSLNHEQQSFHFDADVIKERKRCQLFSPVCPICQRTSVCRIWATWRGMARSSRRLEWRPVACQKPEPSDRLVRLKGRDDCHDCHFWVPWVALQGAAGSGAIDTKDQLNVLQCLW